MLHELSSACRIGETESSPCDDTQHDAHHFEKNVPPSAFDDRQASAIEGQTGDRPPEGGGIGESEVDDQVDEGTDRKSQEAATDRASTSCCDHHEHEDGNDRDDRMKSSSTTPDPVDHVGGQNTDDQQPMIEPWVTEDCPHSEDRGTDEPEEHVFTVRGCGHNADIREQHPRADA